MKRTLRHLLSLLLCLGMILSAGVAVCADSSTPENSCGDNLTWTLEDGTLTISGTGDMYDFGVKSMSVTMSVTIGGPSADNGVKYEYRESTPWCNDADSIQTVVIEEGVTSIGAQAFKDLTNLSTVTIPDGVTSIGWYAFAYCTGLTDLTIPDSVTDIEDKAFANCSGLANLTFLDGVESIGVYAFGGCTNVTSVTIPKSVTSIEMCAFDDCPNLTNVYYNGTEASRRWISISLGNDSLTSAAWHYEG